MCFLTVNNIPGPQSLSIASNPIGDLPRELFALEQLKIIDISDCQFSVLPDLSSAPQLVKLTAKGNKFERLECVASTTLTALDISHNRDLCHVEGFALPKLTQCVSVQLLRTPF